MVDDSFSERCVDYWEVSVCGWERSGTIFAVRWELFGTAKLAG